MNCDQFNADLDAYLDGEAEDAVAVEAHAAACAACGRQLETAGRIGQLLSSLPLPAPRPTFADEALAAAARPRSFAAGRLVAGAFVATFLLSVATVIWTGLKVEAPATRISAALPIVAIEPRVTRVVNLVFNARAPLEDVSLFVTLPRGVEVDGYPDQMQIEWQTSLETGQNVLPLPLVARSGDGGPLVAELADGELRKVFRIQLAVEAG